MTYTDIQLDICGDEQEVAVVRLTRGAKRNALSDSLVLALRNIFEELPSTVRAAVIDGEGPHFCAGLDLSELKERDAGAGLPYHICNWVDHAVTFIRGHRLPTLYSRQLAEWIDLLKNIGFKVETMPMSEGKPFANVMLICRVPL